jgi:hypothetical protein
MDVGVIIAAPLWTGLVKVQTQIERKSGPGLSVEGEMRYEY